MPAQSPSSRDSSDHADHADHSDRGVRQRPLSLSIKILLVRYGPITAIALLVLSSLALLHTPEFAAPVNPSVNPSVMHPNLSNDPATDPELLSCQSHLLLAENAAALSLASAQRSHAVLDSLVEQLKVKDEGKATSETAAFTIPSCPDCPTCLVCPTPVACPEPPPLAPPVLAAPPDPSSPKRWLAVGIPTVPRSENHLGETLESWMRQLPKHPDDPLWQQVMVVVMNMKPKESHEWFEAAKKKYASPHPMSGYFHFTTNDNPEVNPFPGQEDKGDGNHPGFRVRKQVSPQTQASTRAHAHTQCVNIRAHSVNTRTHTLCEHPHTLYCVNTRRALPAIDSACA